MAKFRKVVGRPGVFRVNTTNGKEIKALTPEYWKQVYSTVKDMLSKGLRIPSPFAHRDDSGIVPGPLAMSEDAEVDAKTFKKKTWSSDINAGFWEDFELNEKNELVGIVDIPDDEVSSKIRNTIKETSVFIEPEFTDGLGRVFKNALRHVALVTNPVDPKQDNFELISNKEDYALAMSFSMADEIAQTSGSDRTNSNAEDNTTDATKSSTTSNEDSSCAANIPEIVSLLRDKLGYEMPSDTDEKNFLDRLRTILVSVKPDETQQEMKNLTQKPKDSETQSSTVIMANENTTNETNDNPDNVVLMEKKVSKLLEQHISTLKATLMEKINALIKRGIVGKAKADKDLIPAVNSIAMSLDDMDDEGNLPKTPIEMALDLLDEQVGLLDETGNETHNGETQGHEDEVVSMTPDEEKSLYAELGL